MKSSYIFMAIILIGHHLYAQDTRMVQKNANAIGTAIVCDSLGRPYGEFDVVDNRLNRYIAGRAMVDLFTMQDMIYIDSVQVSDIWRINDNGKCCERVSASEEYYSVLSALIRNKVQEDLRGGFLVYPEKGQMSEHLSRTLFQVKFQINSSLNGIDGQGPSSEVEH